MFLGASTGRAGSVWIARVFNRLGFPCTHEQFFNAKRNPTFEWPARQGEWSAQSVPFLGDHDVPVFHQVRHPLKVIASYRVRGWFDPIDLGPQNQFMVDHAGIDRDGDPLRELARFYVEWNRRIEEHAVMRWQVEGFDDQTAMRVSWLLDRPLKRPLSAALVAEANTSNHPDVKWCDIPEPERTPLRDLAGEYGY